MSCLNFNLKTAEPMVPSDCRDSPAPNSHMDKVQNGDRTFQEKAENARIIDIAEQFRQGAENRDSPLSSGSDE
jgi:hypothetical protein